jgi:hypothetical protein
MHSECAHQRSTFGRPAICKTTTAGKAHGMSAADRPRPSAQASGRPCPSRAAWSKSTGPRPPPTPPFDGCSAARPLAGLGGPPAGPAVSLGMWGTGLLAVTQLFEGSGGPRLPRLGVLAAGSQRLPQAVKPGAKDWLAVVCRGREPPPRPRPHPGIPWGLRGARGACALTFSCALQVG